MNSIKLAEYIWIDGTKPTALTRSKTKIFDYKGEDKVSLADFSDWSFDGSSTNQATGDNSDCILKAVSFVKDPIRGEGNYLVLCEVYNADDTPHATNTRALLRKYLEAGGKEQNPWVGFEQEYTMYCHLGKPLGWPDRGFPAAQGPYYCGVGFDQTAGRKLVEEHAKICIDAGLVFYGINAEVMLGQWEFQIGYRGIDTDDNGALNISDHLWIARWLLYRLAEDHEIEIRLDNKPEKGAWNGAGMHANFSTDDTRDPNKGKDAIKNAINKLEKTHKEHISVYGHGLEERLTGGYETSSIHAFSADEANRGSSIRIPRPVATKGYGYFEDRRPGANSDPYLVAAMLTKSVCC